MQLINSWKCTEIHDNQDFLISSNANDIIPFEGKSLVSNLFQRTSLFEIFVREKQSHSKKGRKSQ